MRVIDIRLPYSFPTVVFDYPEYSLYLPKEIKFEAIDLNHKFWETILTKDYLRRCYDKIGILSKFFHSIRNCFAKNPYKFSVNNLEKAIENLKNPQIFHNPKEYLWSIKGINDALKLISLSYKEQIYLTVLGFMIPYLNTNSFKEILKFVQNNYQNPYYPFLKEFIKGLNNIPDLVCINLRSHHDLVPTTTISLLLKERNPKIHISITNHWWENFTLLTNIENLKNSKAFFDCFDSVVLYSEESTQTILQLVHSLYNKEGLKGISNLAVRENGCIFINKPKEEKEVKGLIKMDKNAFLKFLCSILIPSPVYSTRISQKKCPWSSCSFCVQNIKYLKNQKFDIDEEMKIFVEKAKILSNSDIKYYILRDEGLTPLEIRKLCSLILENNLNIFWSVRSVLDKEFNEDFCRFVAQAGCKEIFFGIESINKRVGMLMNKKDAQLEERRVLIEDIATNFNKVGIGLHLCIIGGFPTETEEEFFETMNFLFNIVKNNNHFSFSLNYFALFKKSAVFNNPSYYHIKNILTRPEDDLKIEHPFIMEKGYPSREKTKNLFFKKREEFYKGLDYYKINYVKKDPSFLDTFLYFVENSGHGLIFKCNFPKNPFIKE